MSFTPLNQSGTASPDSPVLVSRGEKAPRRELTEAGLNLQQRLMWQKVHLREENA